MALVQYNGKNVFGILLKDLGITRLMPGVNEVVDSVLEKIKQHPLFQARVEKGLVKILQDSVGKDGKRTVEELLSLIPNTFDLKLLKKMVDTDGRAPIVKAAQLQIDTIKNPSKVKAEKEDDDHFS